MRIRRHETAGAASTSRSTSSAIPASSTRPLLRRVRRVREATPDAIVARITAANRGSKRRPLHLVPTLWFRNTWSWRGAKKKPSLRSGTPSATGDGASATGDGADVRRSRHSRRPRGDHH